jgi:hypothetical protein
MNITRYFWKPLVSVGVLGFLVSLGYPSFQMMQEFEQTDLNLGQIAFAVFMVCTYIGLLGAIWSYPEDEGD